MSRLSAFVILFALSFICATLAIADCNPVINTASYHFNRDIERNENNLGAGVECGRWQVGAYHNSEWHTTTYVSYGLPLAHVGSIEVGAVVGAVTGYEYAPVVPMVALTVRVGVVRLIIIPPFEVGGKDTGVIGTQIIIPFRF